MGPHLLHQLLQPPLRDEQRGQQAVLQLLQQRGPTLRQLGGAGAGRAAARGAVAGGAGRAQQQGRQAVQHLLLHVQRLQLLAQHLQGVLRLLDLRQASVPALGCCQTPSKGSTQHGR